jgi:hypothetical protein
MKRGKSSRRGPQQRELGNGTPKGTRHRERGQTSEAEMEGYPLAAAEWNDSKIVILSGGEADAKDLTSRES